MDRSTTGRTSADTAPGALVDLRLVPAALGVWAVTWAGLFRLETLVVATTVGAACASCVCATLVSRRGWARVVFVFAALVALSGIAISLRTETARSHPMRSAIGDSATVRVVLHDAPHRLRSSSGGSRRRSIVRAGLRSAWIDGRRENVRGPVLLLVPTRSWRGLTPGQPVTVTGSVIAPRPGDLLTVVLAVHEPPEDVGDAARWQAGAERLRDGLSRVSAQVLSSDAAGLLPGLVVGDTSGQSDAVRRDFERAGLAHLTAVSGSNLAIVSGAVLFVLRSFGSGPVIAGCGAGVGLLGFVVLAGPEPSVLRAAVMGGLALLALVIGRKGSALPALAGTVIGLLLWVPRLATSAGFALSVAATAALILLGPPACAGLRRRGVPRGLAEALAVPAVAQTATAPLLAALNGEVSLVGVVANALVDPVVAPTTVFGLAATLTAGWFPQVAEMVTRLAGLGVEWILLVARRSAELPMSTINWPVGVFGAALIAGAITVAIVVLRDPGLRRTLVVGMILAAAVLVPLRSHRDEWPVAGWSMVVCDVAQGDSLVLATGIADAAVVVDTGPRSDYVDACLDRLGIERVPLIVLTHPHADHIAGLPGVISGRDLGMIAVGCSKAGTWSETMVEERAARHRIPLVRACTGRQLSWPALKLEVLWSGGNDRAEHGFARTANDRSVVIRATTPAGRVLLTGDIELRAQRRLLSTGTDLRADILKVPHHGSPDTHRRFLEAVRPRVAVVSVGAGNDYGHPDDHVLRHLRALGATVRRTDRVGDIAVLGRNGSLRVATRGKPRRPDSG